jgi:hypothetical protein
MKGYRIHKSINDLIKYKTSFSNLNIVCIHIRQIFIAYVKILSGLWKILHVHKNIRNGCVTTIETVCIAFFDGLKTSTFLIRLE